MNWFDESTRCAGPKGSLPLSPYSKLNRRSNVKKEMIIDGLHYPSVAPPLLLSHSVSIQTCLLDTGRSFWNAGYHVVGACVYERCVLLSDCFHHGVFDFRHVPNRNVISTSGQTSKWEKACFTS